jgi:hypothetical protein
MQARSAPARAGPWHPTWDRLLVALIRLTVRSPQRGLLIEANEGRHSDSEQHEVQHDPEAGKQQRLTADQ